MALSYREKSLYASLLAELVVYSSYFVLRRQNSVDKVAAMILAIIVLQIVLQAIIALFSRNRVTDERDRLIELRGYRAGYLTFATLMVVGLALLWFHSTFGHLPINTGKVALHFVSAFFGMLVIADIVKTATQIVTYRRAL
jgi:EamA domain-containing membrane protein RarD